VNSETPRQVYLPKKIYHSRELVGEMGDAHCYVLHTRTKSRFCCNIARFYKILTGCGPTIGP
jgi:hypothetical protein